MRKIGYLKLLEFLILKPSINLTLKNCESHKPFDVCKPDCKSFFERVLAKKKKGSEFNNDIVIHNSGYNKTSNKTNSTVLINLENISNFFKKYYTILNILNKI